MISNRSARHGIFFALAAVSAVLLGRGVVQVQDLSSVGTLFRVFLPFLAGLAFLGLYGAYVLNPGSHFTGSGTPLSIKVFSLGMALGIAALLLWLNSATAFTLTFLISCGCVGLVMAVFFMWGRTPLHGYYASLLLIPLLNLFSSELPESLFNHISLGPILMTPAILLVGLCAITVLLRRSAAWNYVRREPLLFFSIGLYGILGFHSIFLSPDRWMAVNQWLLEGFYPVLGFLIVIHVVHDQHTWRQCFEGILLCAGEMAVFGWYFFVRPNPGDVDVRHFYGANLLVNLPSANLAQLLVLFWPVAWVAASRSSGWRQVLLGGIGLLFLASILLSYSRSALLGMAISMLMLLKQPRLRRWILALVVATVLFAVIRPTQFRTYGMTRLSENQGRTLLMDNDLSWRIEAWQGSYQLLKDFPWGVGIGQWARYVTGYTLPRMTKLAEGNEWIFISSPHNLFLNFAVETGWIGLGSLVLLFVSLMAIVTKSLASAEWDALRYGFLAGLVAFIVSGLFAADLFAYRLNIVSGLLFWSFAGLALCLPSMAGQP